MLPDLYSTLSCTLLPDLENVIIVVVGLNHSFFNFQLLYFLLEILNVIFQQRYRKMMRHTGGYFHLLPGLRSVPFVHFFFVDLSPSTFEAITIGTLGMIILLVELRCLVLSWYPVPSVHFSPVIAS